MISSRANFASEIVSFVKAWDLRVNGRNDVTRTYVPRWLSINPAVVLASLSKSTVGRNRRFKITPLCIYPNYGQMLSITERSTHTRYTLANH